MKEASENGAKKQGYQDLSLTASSPTLAEILNRERLDRALQEERKKAETVSSWKRLLKPLEQTFPSGQKGGERYDCTVAFHETQWNNLDGENESITVATFDKENVTPFSRPVEWSTNTKLVAFSQKEQSLSEKIIRKSVLPPDLRQMKSTEAWFYVCTHPAEFVKDSSYVIFVDPSIEPVGDLSYLINRISPSLGLAMAGNPKRDDLYLQAASLSHQHLYNAGYKKKISLQMSRYRNAGFPRHFGLGSMQLLAVDLNNEKGLFILDQWWKEYQKSGKTAPELSLPFVLWENNYLWDDIGLLMPDPADCAKLHVKARSETGGPKKSLLGKIKELI